MSELAVKGCVVSLSSTLGQLSITSKNPEETQSDENFVGSNGIFFDKVTVDLSGLTITPATPVAGTTNQGVLSTGSIDIKGTASDILDKDDNKAVQKGDKETKTFSFVFTNSPPATGTTPVDFPVTAEITDAGQTDVIAV